MIEYTRPVKLDDDIFTVESFIEHVNSGCFTDYDGHCRYSNGTHTTSKGWGDDMYRIPAEVTHIVWYNK